jgi:hypothetical protein
MLPKISIKVDDPPLEFVKKLEQIATQSGSFDIDKVFDMPGFEGFGSLNLMPKATNQHEKLVGQLTIYPDEKSRVFIEMRAKHWNPDPPTYETYVEAARLLFEPIIRAYNKEHNSRRRLNIQAKADKEPTLPPETKKQFKAFVICANKSGLHPNDWERFYRFIRFCHARHVKLSKGTLRYLLGKAGFNNEKAEHLAEVYYHGRKILEVP